MHLYLDNGYLDMKSIIHCGMPFILLIGARGTGKTYGAAVDVIEERIPFVWMRRLQTATDEINKVDFSIYKTINRKLGWNVYPFKAGKYSAVYRDGEYNDKGKLVATSEPYGITTSLSTVAHLRGIDVQEAKILIYDEFIPEEHERPMRGEGAAYLNAYETINRNREFDGEPPLISLCMANSNDLGNPLMVEMELVEAAIKLQKSKREYMLLEDRGIALIMPKYSPISQRKASTALYKMTANQKFAGMALRNTFAIEGEAQIGSRDLKEYRPVLTVGSLTVYEHKSKEQYYVSHHHAGTAETYTDERIELLRFKDHNMWLWGAHMDRLVLFETYSAMRLLEEYFSTT